MLLGINAQLKCGKDTFAELTEESGVVFTTLKFADALKDITCRILGCTREDLEDQDFKNKELGKKWWYIKKWYPTNPNHDKVFTLIPYIGFDSRIFDGDDCCAWELIKLTPRLILQLLGTEAGREIIHPQIWVNCLMTDYEKLLIGAVAIVTDMRFKNELETISTEPGGYTVKILRKFSLRFPEYAYLENSDNNYEVPSKLKEVDPKLYKVLKHVSETDLLESNVDFVIYNDSTLQDFKRKVVKVFEYIANETGYPWKNYLIE